MSECWCCLTVEGKCRWCLHSGRAQGKLGWSLELALGSDEVSPYTIDSKEVDEKEEEGDISFVRGLMAMNF